MVSFRITEEAFLLSVSTDRIVSRSEQRVNWRTDLDVGILGPLGGYMLLGGREPYSETRRAFA